MKLISAITVTHCSFRSNIFYYKIAFWTFKFAFFAKGMYEGVTAGRMIPTDRPTAWGGEEIFSGVTDEIDETDRS